VEVEAQLVYGSYRGSRNSAEPREGHGEEDRGDHG